MSHTLEAEGENGATVGLRRFVRQCAWIRRKEGSARSNPVELRRRPLLGALVLWQELIVGSRWAAGWRGGGWRGSRSGGCARSRVGADAAESAARTRRRATS